MQQKQELINNLQSILDNPEINATQEIFYWVKDNSPQGRKLKGAIVEVSTLKSDKDYFDKFIKLTFDSEDFLDNYRSEYMVQEDFENVEIFYPIPPANVPSFRIVPRYNPDTNEPKGVTVSEDLYSMAEEVYNLGKSTRDSTAFKGDTIYLSGYNEDKTHATEVSVLLYNNPNTGRRYYKPLTITIK